MNILLTHEYAALIGCIAFDNNHSPTSAVNAHAICLALFLTAFTTGDMIHFFSHVANQAFHKARNHFAHQETAHHNGTSDAALTASTHNCVIAVAFCLNHFAFLTSSRALGIFTAEDNADHT